MQMDKSLVKRKNNAFMFEILKFPKGISAGRWTVTYWGSNHEEKTSLRFYSILWIHTALSAVSSSTVSSWLKKALEERSASRRIQLHQLYPLRQVQWIFDFGASFQSSILNKNFEESYLQQWTLALSKKVDSQYKIDWRHSWREIQDYIKVGSTQNAILIS